MAKLSIHIRGQLIEETNINLPEFFNFLEFEDNVNMRKNYIDKEAALLKVNHIRKILKIGKYKTFLTIESKMNDGEY